MGLSGHAQKNDSFSVWEKITTLLIQKQLQCLKSSRFILHLSNNGSIFTAEEEGPSSPLGARGSETLRGGDPEDTRGRELRSQCFHGPGSESRTGGGTDVLKV